MSIIVYGEKASRTHENQMLQAFLEHLEDRWTASDDWILVVANTMWNGTEIDLVCIRPSAILVADFKGHRGKLTGTENGPWQADGVLVKGGNKANPYQQLRDNKFSVLDWLKSKSLLSGRNLGHISAGVIFSGRIVDQLELPPKVRSWLYPTDLETCVTLLDGPASPELWIDRKEAQEIVQRLGVQAIEWKSTRPTIRPIESGSLQTQDRPPLTQHQQEALQALCSFVSSDDLVTFSVLGMTSTGKSSLLAEAVTEIKKVGKTPIVLSPNRRLAMHAEAKSIYAHLYGGGEAKNEEKKKEEGSAGEEPELDVISLRLCTDDAKCVYLLDDAHLLGNSRFTTPDGKLYGSGHLLDDFLAFTELGKTKRKAIYFGDPFQIQRSGDDESPLLGEFQKSRELKHQSLELNQVIDTTGGSAKLANAERLVKAIRSKRFAELDLLEDRGFRQSAKQEAAEEMLELYRSDPLSVWYLAETHAKTSAFTQWVRERLRDKKQLACLEVGELLEIYVAPKSEGFTPETDDFLIQPGHRRRTTSVGTKEYYAQSLRGRPAPILFHSVHCTLEGVDQPSLEILEEFLISKKPELNADTAIAIRVRRKSNEQPFSYVRFGYASTVHHAQGMSQPICYVNSDHTAGRHSEGYFRWLYSALTVAERELVLVNFSEIHPFDSAVWNASAVAVAKDIPVGGGWSFEPNGVAPEKDQQRDVPRGLDRSNDVLTSAAIWLRIANVVERLGWRVVKATCHPYQEQYDLIGPNGEQCQLRIAYNGKNVVTAIHVNDPVFWPLLADVASDCLESNSYTQEVEGLIRSFRSRLGGKGWKVVSSTETAYRLTITVARGLEERVVIEVNFDKQGLVSSLRPLQTVDPGLLEEIKRALL